MFYSKNNLTSIMYGGQKFVDEPVYILLDLKPEFKTEVAKLFNQPQPIKILSHYNRVRLKWI